MWRYCQSFWLARCSPAILPAVVEFLTFSAEWRMQFIRYFAARTIAARGIVKLADRNKKTKTVIAARENKYQLYANS